MKARRLAEKLGVRLMLNPAPSTRLVNTCHRPLCVLLRQQAFLTKQTGTNFFHAFERCAAAENGRLQQLACFEAMPSRIAFKQQSTNDLHDNPVFHSLLLCVVVSASMHLAQQATVSLHRL